MPLHPLTNMHTTAAAIHNDRFRIIPIAPSTGLSCRQITPYDILINPIISFKPKIASTIFTIIINYLLIQRVRIATVSEVPAFLAILAQISA